MGLGAVSVRTKRTFLTFRTAELKENRKSCDFCDVNWRLYPSKSDETGLGISLQIRNGQSHDLLSCTIKNSDVTWSLVCEH